jgi:RNA polymerase sigma-70 factor (ECF subfamily)
VARKLPEDAADVVQRVFLGCLQADRDGRELRHPRGLLYAIARREIVDHLAATARAAFDPLVTSFADVATSPTQRLVRREAERALMAALDALPIDHQLALELYYWEELSMQDVADALGISRSAAINRIHRARAQLRERLASASTGEAERTALAEVERWAAQEPDSEA